MFFSYLKVYIFWRFIQYIIHWDKTNFRDVKLISSTFNSQFLYELQHKVRLSKGVFGIFHFRFRFVFIKVYVFFNKKHGLFDFKSS